LAVCHVVSFPFGQILFATEITEDTELFLHPRDRLGWLDPLP
jgi:hypothetical protein